MLEVNQYVKVNNKSFPIAKILGINIEEIYQVLDVRKQNRITVKICIDVEGIEKFFPSEYFVATTESPKNQIVSDSAYKDLYLLKRMRRFMKAPPESGSTLDTNNRSSRNNNNNNFNGDKIHE